jgi:excisionase family DNA binding protein
VDRKKTVEEIQELVTNCDRLDRLKHGNYESKKEVLMKALVPIERITSKIYLIRGMKVMLDRDLAELYDVETKVLKQAIRRNIGRFPEDFMFELSKEEFKNLRSQIVTSSWGGLRYLPMVFSEQGVAMLSSVLRSERAIQVNIQIMRAFTQLRQMLSTHEDLKRKIESMERKYDQQFQIVFEAIKQLLETDEKPKKKIGYTVKEKQKAYGKKRKRTVKKSQEEVFDEIRQSPFTIKEASEYLEIAEITLKRWVKAGTINYKRVGRNIVFDPDDLKSFKRGKQSGKE